MRPNIHDLQIIDTHLHLWDPGHLNYSWLQDVPAINKTFLIEDYQAQTANFNIKKMIFVQCESLPEQALAEIAFVEAQSLKDPRIQGIVAYAPLEKGIAIKPILEQYRANPLIKGVRRMYDDIPMLCTDPDFLKAVQALPAHELTMDLSIKPSSIQQTLSMIKSCPDTQFILDHLGKPDIKNYKYEDFKQNMEEFAALPNVLAKVSGLVTEADWKNWSDTEINEYINYAIKCFGSERLMFGGDWPVVLLASSYEKWLQTLFNSLSTYSDSDLHSLFYKTAESVYKL